MRRPAISVHSSAARGPTVNVFAAMTRFGQPRPFNPLGILSWVNKDARVKLFRIKNKIEESTSSALKRVKSTWETLLSIRRVDEILHR